MLQHEKQRRGDVKDPLKEEFSQNQAKQARERHAVKCHMMPGKRIPQRRPLTELYVDGKFMEDRGVRNNELQRLCEEGSEDAEGAMEEQ